MTRALRRAGLPFGLALFVCLPAWAEAPSADARPVWFDAPAFGPAFDARDDAALAVAVVAALRAATSEPDNLPAAMTADQEPRIVFVSVSDTYSRAMVSTGAAIGMATAVRQALAACLPRLPPPNTPLWVKVDQVRRARGPYRVPARSLDLFERSLDGLAFDARLGLALLPEELVCHTLVTAGGELRASALDKYLQARRPSGHAVQLARPLTNLRYFAFNTTAWFSDGVETYPLYRGRRQRDSLDVDTLMSAARAAGDYLARSVDANGKFVYRYLAKTDRAADDYNLVRHAGTVFSLWQLAGKTRDAELIAAARRATEYLLRTFRPFGPDGGPVAVLEGDEIKLGAVALAAIALIEYTEATGDKQYVPLAGRLAAYLADAQRADGGFVAKRRYPDGKTLRGESIYYPGEALLALVRVHDHDGNERWLDAAVRGARYLIHVRDQNGAVKDLPHDHWLLYALDRLHRKRPHDDYLAHTRRMVRAILAAQYRSSAIADWRGSYNQPPRSGPTATRLEGLLAAWRLLRDHGAPKETEAILNSCWSGICFLLRLQVEPEKAMYLPNPRRALGGFHRGMSDYEIRNDYCQHALSALLDAIPALTASGARVAACP